MPLKEVIAICLDQLEQSRLELISQWEVYLQETKQNQTDIYQNLDFYNYVLSAISSQPPSTARTEASNYFTNQIKKLINLTQKKDEENIKKRQYVELMKKNMFPEPLKDKLQELISNV